MCPHVCAQARHGWAVVPCRLCASMHAKELSQARAQNFPHTPSRRACEWVDFKTILVHRQAHPCCLAGRGGVPTRAQRVAGARRSSEHQVLGGRRASIPGCPTRARNICPDRTFSCHAPRERRALLDPRALRRHGEGGRGCAGAQRRAKPRCRRPRPCSTCSSRRGHRAQGALRAISVRGHKPRLMLRAGVGGEWRLHARGRGGCEASYSAHAPLFWARALPTPSDWYARCAQCLTKGSSMMRACTAMMCVPA